MHHLKKGSEDCRLQNLSKQQLAALLRSTYEYKIFVQYFDEHQLAFLDKLPSQRRDVSKKREPTALTEYSDQSIFRELEDFNQQEGLRLHNYHQDLIYQKFKKYYEHYEDKKATRMANHYEHLISKEQKNCEGLPEQLSEVCLQKQKELVRQVMRKKNKTLAL